MRARASGLHRFSVGLVVGVVLLIAAGALVKSREAGLSVPDWPLSYGSLNPPRWWQIENVRTEHGHRLFAGAIALATVGLALWARRREPRRRVRAIVWAAVGAVALQAALGGVTVLLFLPPAVSISHAALAELFLCLVVTIAVVTGPGWLAPAEAPRALPTPSGVRALAAALPPLVFAQILLGAVVRHLGAGLAIPDFPLVFGGLLPPHWSLPIAVHFIHRVGAVVILGLVAFLMVRVARRARGERGLTGPTLALAALTALQILLGGAIVWSSRAVLPNTAHVVVGASILATSVVLALNAWRKFLAPRLAGAGREPVETAPRPAPALSR
jgi:cytochrome c oxidase assembly protein subunit 15